MSSGLSQALSGAMDRRMKSFDVVANNLANVNTVGFKLERSYFQMELDNARQGKASDGLRTYTNFSQGMIRTTSVPTDVAIEGAGFFKVQEGDQVYYTRQGNFHVDVDGNLATPSGFKVLGGNGPVQVAGNNLTIARDGSVLEDGREVARLELVEVDTDRLEKHGQGVFLPVGEIEERPVEMPNLIQGGLELSNVNAFKEVTRMVENMRGFESYNRILKKNSEVNQKLDELGSVG
ncbi:MAG TPA: flagellar hook basal-body protein [Desulfomicrobiaceae bacterium]|nr:flagellar hook basal-body protein [Desulfomicrobiaceae bacterium]